MFDLDDFLASDSPTTNPRVTHKDQQLVREWARSVVELPPIDTAANDRRELYSRLDEHGFLPTESWDNVIDWAVRESGPCEPHSALPVGFQLSQCHQSTKYAAELLTTMLFESERFELSAYSARLREIESTLRPLERARLATFISAMPFGLPINFERSDTAQFHLLQAAVELSLLPLSERPKRRKELVEKLQTTFKGIRKVATRFAKNWPHLVKLDPYLFAELTHEHVNVNAGMTVHKQQSASEEESSSWSHVWTILLVLSTTLKACSSFSGSQYRPPVYVPPVVNSFPNYNVGRESQTARIPTGSTDPDITKRSAEDLRHNPPRAGLVIEAFNFFNRDQCEALIAAYAVRKQHETVEPEATHLNLAIVLLRQRISEIDANAKTTTPGTESEGDPGAAGDKPRIQFFVIPAPNRQRASGFNPDPDAPAVDPPKDAPSNPSP